MLIALLFLILSLLSFWTHPIEHLNLRSLQAHSFCLELVPNSNFQSETQAILCGENLRNSNELIQSTGLIHFFVIFGFQIYLLHRLSKIMFHNDFWRNIFLLITITGSLSLSAFHPAAVRAALSLLLSEFSSQQKLFWSRLQISIFTGFLCLALAPSWIKNYSLLIGWTASMSFGFLTQRHLFIKNIGTYLCLLPILWGLLLPHPLLAIGFSLITRPILFFLLPLCLLFCCSPWFNQLGELFWKNIFSSADVLTHIFLPLQVGTKFSLLQIWFYILTLMIFFLYFENQRLRQK